jgi:hypothetical protein
VAYIRVKDTSTGHEFDALEDAWQIEAGIYVPVKPKQYPPSQYPRPAKHNVGPVRATNNESEEPSNG